MKESQFGKTLASMLALKFQTSEGELNALNQALEELEDLLNQQQEADDQQFSDKSSALSNLIGSNQETIAETTGSLADLNNQLSQNQLDLGDANVNLSNLEQDAQAITELLAQLAELRANEQARHDSAVRVQSALVAGLQRVVELFQGAQSNSEIDQGAVTNILGLLDQLIAAFQASVADENALELQSESDYVSTVTPKQSQLDEDNDAISQLNVLIPAIEATVAQLQSSIASAEQTLANAEQLLAEYQTELQTATNTHSNNSVTRYFNFLITYLTY